MGYGKNLLVGIDQLGNAVAGGNPDNTISARVGFNCFHNEDLSFKKFWSFLRFFIDTTFYPFDGNGHCHAAFHNDEEEIYDKGTKNWAVIVLSIIIITSCIPIAIVAYLGFFLGIVRPQAVVTIDH